MQIPRNIAFSTILDRGVCGVGIGEYGASLMSDCMRHDKHDFIKHNQKSKDMKNVAANKNKRDKQQRRLRGRKVRGRNDVDSDKSESENEEMDDSDEEESALVATSRESRRGDTLTISSEEMSIKDVTIARLEAELYEAKRRLEMALIASNQVSERDMSREFKDYDLQINGIMKNIFLRHWKFWEEGMEQWDDEKDSVCQLFITKIQMPAGSTKDDKKRLWEGFIAMRLCRKVSIHRNKIVQDMRQTYYSEFIVNLDSY